MKSAKRSLASKAIVAAMSISSLFSLMQPAQAGQRFDDMGEGVFLTVECQSSSIIGFRSTTVTMTVTANGSGRTNQRLSEVFLLGRDPVSDSAIRVIERYRRRGPQQESFTVVLRNRSAERVELVDGSIAVEEDGRRTIVDVPYIVTSCS